MRCKRTPRWAAASLLAALFALAPALSTPAAETPPIRALLICGGCCHDYAHQKKILTEGISARANVEWTIVHEGDGSTTHKVARYNDPDWAKGFDVVVHDECFADVKDQAFVEGILKPHRAGLPAVNLHCAMHCYRVSFDNFKGWFEFTGIDTRYHGAQLPIDLTYVDAKHPILQGLANWRTINEELYNAHQVFPSVTPLIYGAQGNDKNLIAWANDYHGTRVFSTTLGHNNETVADARYLDLITRGLLWSVDKLKPEYQQPAKRVLAPVKPGKTVLAPINLALGKPATASGSQDGHAPGDAVDGDPETRWCAPDGGNGYWWQVDLQKPQDLTGCRIVWEQENVEYHYKVEASTDAKTWRPLVTVNSGARPQTDDQKFTAAGVQYVRVTVTQAGGGSWASFFECQVWGKEMVPTSAGRAAAAPDSRLAEVKVPAGFVKTIFAAPPDISYPVCVAASPTGEVFVGVDQNGSLDAKPDRGWVVRCVDTDGDGIADKFNIFAKMDSPRGVVYDHNTLYVMHPPVLEAYYDDNGDGIADRSEVLVSGLAHDLKFRGADHTCNGVRMGIDGWLYIALGDYGATHAVAKDGSELQVHGGGIVRVRPDGTELELVVAGTRNIYDVAIDPLMNIFTCDNTNDGDDWNVRLTHMIPESSIGYPSLFRNHADEMFPTMVDYGGGSPTGSLFLDEPGFPAGYGYGLYTCQWGWNSVSRHPLTADGASFKAPSKDTFIGLTRPTGIDADGEGNVYAASWKGATFNFSGPNVGYIARVTPADYKPTPFPDLAKATDAQLLTYMESPSAVWRQHIQREILRRGNKPGFATGLERIALNHAHLPVRVAAIFTLKQLLGAAAQEPLLRLVRNDAVRQYALKALADRKPQATQLPSKVFTDALGDANPAVRLQAVIALDRLGRTEAAPAILPHLADADAAITHLAFRALVDLKAAEVCFQALDQSKTTLVPGATRVLRNLHEPKVVAGLLERLQSGDMVANRQAILETLCRLYYREADWDGTWWGTRPDTSGPYFKWTTWSESEKIGQALLAAVSKADEATLRYLLTAFQANKLDLPGLSGTLLTIASQKPAARPAVVELFGRQTSLTKETIGFLESVATDAKAETGLRTKAFDALVRDAGQNDAVEAVVRVLGTAAAGPDGGAFAKQLRDTFVRDRRHARNAGYFQKLAAADNAGQRELAYAVLIQIANTQNNQARQARTTAQQAIANGWVAGHADSLLRAVGDVHSTNYNDQVKGLLADTRPAVAAAAGYAAKALGLAAPAAGAASAEQIGKLAYADVLAAAIKIPGNPAAGAPWFEKLACVKCHTIDKSEPLKGPFLGDIATRYGRPEIIESILHPSAQIAQGFVTTTVETKDGNEYDGFIVRESGDILEIRNLAGATSIPQKDIVKRGTRTTSIMPEGLADTLTPTDLANLVAWLQSLKAK